MTGKAKIVQEIWNGSKEMLTIFSWFPGFCAERSTCMKDLAGFSFFAATGEPDANSENVFETT